MCLLHLDFPDTLRAIGPNCFVLCPSLWRFNAGPGCAGFTTLEDGQVLFSRDGKTLLAAGCDLSGAYAVPEGTENIAPWAFMNAPGVTALTLPASLRSIGAGAFSGCSLRELAIPAGVERIGWSEGYKENDISTIAQGVSMYCVAPGSAAEEFCQAFSLNYSTQPTGGAAQP